MRSTSRSSTSTRPPYSDTRPSTRTVSPTSKRPSSSGTASQTRPATRPERSASSMSRYGRPSLRARLRLRVTAKVPSTSDPATRSCTMVAPAIERSIVLYPAGMALGAETITDVRPFRALHFDPARVDLATVVTPPYDVIDAAQRARLAERSEHNGVRLILPDPGDEAAAGALFESWLDQGIVVRE